MIKFTYDWYVYDCVRCHAIIIVYLQPNQRYGIKRFSINSLPPSHPQRKKKTEYKIHLEHEQETH